MGRVRGAPPLLVPRRRPRRKRPLLERTRRPPAGPRSRSTPSPPPLALARQARRTPHDGPAR
eukprot:7229954-Lingulodinium_polyedra.AAC.1